MKTLPFAEARAKLSLLVDRVAAMDEEILITRNGRPAAVLVSPDECRAGSGLEIRHRASGDGRSRRWSGGRNV